MYYRLKGICYRNSAIYSPQTQVFAEPFQGINQAYSSQIQFPHNGIFLPALGSLVNHSCNGNLAIDFEKDRTISWLALRDIQPGEELTISYIDETLDVEDRQFRLRNYWGFTCQCEKCKRDMLEEQNREGNVEEEEK